MAQKTSRFTIVAVKLKRQEERKRNIKLKYLENEKYIKIFKTLSYEFYHNYNYEYAASNDLKEITFVNDFINSI